MADELEDLAEAVDDLLDSAWSDDGVAYCYRSFPIDAGASHVYVDTLGGDFYPAADLTVEQLVEAARSEEAAIRSHEAKLAGIRLLIDQRLRDDVS